MTGEPLRILYLAQPWGTCKHRAAALRELGHEVTYVAAETPTRGPARWVYWLFNKIDWPPDVLGANRQLGAALGRERFDVVWVDKGRSIRPATLRAIRRRWSGTLLVNYSPDDQLNPANQSIQYRGCLGLYHLHVTTKSYNVAELAELGAVEVLAIDNAYDPATHRPVVLDDAERARYDTDVGFVGCFEAERAEQLVQLARLGFRVKLWGYGWDRLTERPPPLDVRNRWLDDVEYPKSIAATRINLGFLRKINRDLQTTRSIEIPAAGGFLLAERTVEHERLFVEGREAEFFASFDELVAKCRYYLEHDDERVRIAEAGRRRCVEGGYSNAGQLSRVLPRVRQLLALSR